MEHLVVNHLSVKTPHHVLGDVYGYAQFQGLQEEIISHVIGGKHAFVLMPTGSGKSLCYQIPALCMDGVAVVISPLIALMHDQVSAMQQLGVRAAAIHSGLAPAEVYQAKELIRTNGLDMIYVAPERLLMEDFLALLGEAKLALFAIDEAHCVSQWGHDFRPHYTGLSALAEHFPDVPRIALTATADEPTRKDIVERLHLAEGKTFVSGFDRPNIRYSIVERQKAKQQMLSFITEHHVGHSGIVYCLSRKATEETAAWLNQQGMPALAYHGGMSAAERAANQNRFLQEEQVIMVATIAFGMGIDKPDVRFVVHMNIPKNIEAYYQETGRAGRDGLPADALMIYGMNDTALLRDFIEKSDAPEQQKRIEHHKLNALIGLCEATCCRRQVLLEYFSDSCEPCNNCDTCLSPPETFDGTVPAQMAISCVYRTDQRFGVGYLIDVLLGKANDRMVSFGHHQISTFGIGTDYHKNQWQSIFRQLIAQNLLKVDVVGYGGLQITAAGRDFLKQRRSIHLRRYTKKAKVPKEERSSKVTPVLKEAADHRLLAALKAKRLEFAQEQHVPPYVIFHDKTLTQMALEKPTNEEQMSHISGVGKRKIARYGEVFLTLIAEHVEQMQVA